MRTKICLLFAFFTFAAFAPRALAQTDPKDPDIELKMQLYNQYKKEALGYTKRDFDDLFFEFFSRMDDVKTVLTKEEYYTYTIKIAIYNERQGLLYKDKKRRIQDFQRKMVREKYQDYLSSK